MTEFGVAPWASVKDSDSDIDWQVRQMNRGAPAEVLGLVTAQNSRTRRGAACLPALAFIPYI